MVLQRSRLMVGLASLCFFILIMALVFSGVTQGIDTSLAIAINTANLGDALTSIMLFFTVYGREYFWIPVVAIMLIFGNRETKFLAIELSVLFILGIVFGEALKILVFRERPYHLISGIVLRGAGDVDSSFPSGHAIIVAIGAVFSLIKIKKRAIGLVLTFEAAVVCYSRVYTGLHYPLDVLAGIVLAVAIVELGLFVMERYLSRQLTMLSALVVRILRDGPLRL